MPPKQKVACSNQAGCTNRFPSPQHFSPVRPPSFGNFSKCDRPFLCALPDDTCKFRLRGIQCPLERLIHRLEFTSQPTRSNGAAYPRNLTAARGKINGMMRPSPATAWREVDWFVARCPDPDIASQGRTEEEALANLREALELHFELPLATRPPGPSPKVSAER